MATYSNVNSLTSKYTWLGICVFGLVLYFASKNPVGHDIIFYGLFLILIFLVVTHYQQLQADFVKPQQ